MYRMGQSSKMSDLMLLSDFWQIPPFLGSSLRHPLYKLGNFFMPGKVLKTIYFLKGSNADKSNLIILGLEKQKGITHETLIVHFLYIIYTKNESYTKKIPLWFWALRVIYPLSVHQDLLENI